MSCQNPTDRPDAAARASLPRARLGRTGLEVTRLGYGAMQLRGPAVMKGPEVSEDRAAETLNAVLDAGMTLIDTARGYGLSEERIGRHIAHRRNQFVLATKTHCAGGWSRDGVLREVEASLKALRTDSVEILQLHGPTPEECRGAGLVQALRTVQSRGLVRFVGVSTQLPEIFEFIEWGEFDVFQFPCSAIQQKHRPAMERAAAAGAGILARGAVSWGGPVGGGAKGWVHELWNLARLDELLDGMTPPELLLRCTLCHPDAHANLVGSADPEHVRANAAAAVRGPLPEPLRAEVECRLETAREAIRRAAPPPAGH